MGQTFVILKPDCLERGLVGRVLSRFEDRNLRIVGCQFRWKSEDWARNHYSHLEPEILERNVTFMTVAPVLGVVLSGPENIITIVQQIVGATFDARPGSVRGDFETTLPYNLAHASDSEENYLHEVQDFFNAETDRINTSPAGDAEK